jgi:hypothetical protein
MDYSQKSFMLKSKEKPMRKKLVGKYAGCANPGHS